MATLVDTYMPREWIERETEKAYLFAVPQGVTQYAKPRMAWMPKAHVTWIAHSPYAETAHVPAWLARKLA
jgi:hypothetical protein